MNYEKHYDLLIERARTRELPKEVYTERHHILPKCLGGTDNKSNLVILTAEEHYLAHQLLVKIHPDNIRIAYAANAMIFNNPYQYRNNKMYGWLRRRFAKAVSENMSGVSFDERHGKEKADELREHFRNLYTGSIRGPMEEDHKKKISESRKGFRQSEETKKKLSRIRKGKEAPNKKEHKKIYKVSEETRKKMREGCLKRNTPEYLQKLKNIQSKNAKQVLCVETGRIFNSTAAAAKWANPSCPNISAISNCAKNKSGHYSAYGYNWEYI